MKRLALENLLSVQPRRGTFVSDVDSSDIVNITEVRAELEGYAAELAAERMEGVSRIAAESLLREVDELSRPDDQDWLMRFDERIHRFTWEASGNPYLTETLERYFTHSLRIWYLVLDRLPGLGHAVHDQGHLLEALLAQDGARARSIMREHVLGFQRELWPPSADEHPDVHRRRVARRAERRHRGGHEPRDRRVARPGGRGRPRGRPPRDRRRERRVRCLGRAHRVRARASCSTAWPTSASAAATSSRARSRSTRASR